MYGIKCVIVFVITFIIQASTFAATYTAVTSGYWANTNTWDLSGTPTMNDNIIIPVGDTVFVDNPVGQPYDMGSAQIEIYGVLDLLITGSISLDSNGVIYIVDPGQIISDPNSMSNAATISINGEDKWKGQDGTVTGDRAITNASDPINSPNFQTTIPPGALLPIDLMYFRAELIDASKVLLKWATATEENNDYFLIQRSSNGRDWETIDKIKGALISSSTIEYQAYDNNAFRGTIWYRLVQVDTDGSSTTFKVVVVKNEITTNTAVYPNPSKGLFNFSHEAFGYENCTIRIFSATGQLIEQAIIKDKIVTIDLTKRENGVYIYQIEDLNGILSSGVTLKN